MNNILPTKKSIILLTLFFLIKSIGWGQVTYYSKAAATNFTDVNSWGTATDGTGSSPAIITTADNYIIDNNASILLNGNASVRSLTINTGTFTISSNTLLVEIATQNNTEFLISPTGSLIVNGGTINLRGAMYFANGSTFTHTGGVISVDGNSGVAATSVGGASGSNPIFGIGYTTGGTANAISNAANAAKFSLTGGKIQIVDPNAGSSLSGYAFAYRAASGAHITSGTAHTIELGNGTITNNGGNENGYLISPQTVSSGRLNIGRLVINTTTNNNNRHVTGTASSEVVGILGDLIIMSGSEIRGNISVAGDIINDGTLTTVSGLSLQRFIGNSVGASTVGQTISGSGVFRNSVTGPTASFNNLTLNNTSASGITFASPVLALTGGITGNVANAITFLAGKINTAGQTFTMGTNTGSGTFNYVSGGFTSGTKFSRKFLAGFTGSDIFPGMDPNSFNGLYPFVTSSGNIRWAFLERNTPTLSETIDIQYNEVAGNTSVSIVDGAYTVNRRSNDNWVVSGTSSPQNYELAIYAPGIYNAPDNTTRIVLANSVVGTHQLGTITPVGQRILTQNQLLNTFYLGINAPILPVSIISFDVIKSGENSVKLIWEVADEINVEEYIVERSTDSKVWSAIGSQRAEKNALYEYEDNSPLQGVNYYRLLIKDFNSSVNFSSVRSANFSKNTGLILYPSPASNQIFISGSADKEVMVLIKNDMGHSVKNFKMSGLELSSVGIDISALHPGAYNIQIKGDSDAKMMKFIKQ